MTDHLLQRSSVGWAALMAIGATAAVVYVQAEFGAGVLPLVAGAALAAAAAALLAVLARLRPIAIIAVAAALSLVVRIAAAVWLYEVETANDPRSYLRVSQWLLGREPAGMPMAYYPPLYPHLLALIRSAVPDPGVAIPLLNALIDGMAALLLYRLGRRLVSRTGAALATAAWLLWPPLLAGSAVAQKEGLSVVLFLGLCLALVRWVGSGRSHDALLAGLAWGLMALAQPGLALLPLFLFLGVAAIRARSPSETIRALLVAIAATCLTLMPWWIRNYLLLGSFVPLSTAGGYAFVRLVPDHVLTLSASQSPLGEADRSAVLIRKSVAWIAGHPMQYVGNVVVRAGRGLLLDIGAVQQFLWFRPAPRAGTILTFMSLCQLASAGVWSAAALALHRLRQIGSEQRVLLALFAATAAHVLLVSIWVQFYDRHRQVLTPLAMLCAAPLIHGEVRRRAE